VIDTELTPRLRGVFHQWAFVAAIAAGVVLVVFADGPRENISSWVYAAALAAMFGASALYHRFPWKTTARRLWARRLDHSMIFVFIAGTYTPIAALTLPRSSAVPVLIVVWSGAVSGVLLQTLWPHAPRWLSVPCYLGLGWVAVFVMPTLLHNAGVAALVLIVVGGLFYSIGALVYGFKKPDPFPQVFGFHEVFHLCTLIAAVCHYVAIWLAVFR